MTSFSKTALEIPRSGIREIMALSADMDDVIHLEVGQPDFPTPDHIVDATCRYVNDGHTKYVANGGVNELRDAAARYFERKTGVATGANNILITQGAVLSIATSILAVLDPGEEILLPDPGWPNYESAALLFQRQPVSYHLRPENQFLPDLAELDAQVTANTRALLICNPSNPTGQSFPPEIVEGMMEIARRHDLWLISDEIYGDLVFDSKHTSVLGYDSDERSIVISGMSKSYAMTGYRVGFTRANPDYIELATKLQEPLVSCGVGFAQLAAVVGLDGPQDCVTEMRDAYRSRRNAALGVLREHGMYQYTPQGALYLLVDISATGMDSHDFALQLLHERGVAVAPGSAFGQMCQNHVRVSIAAPEDKVVEGLERICQMIEANTE